MSPHTAFYVLSVTNAGGVLSRLAPPFLSDTLGRYNVLVPCAFLAGLSIFLSGAFNALVIPCIAQISEVREIGTRVGVLYSIISFPALCGGPAAGALQKAQTVRTLA